MPRPPTGQVLERSPGRFALRFRAYGVRRYVTLDVSTREEAKRELGYILADVERGIWKPPTAAPVVEPPTDEPMFWDFARAWLERREGEVDRRTVEHWEWALNTHLREPFGRLLLSEITVQVVDHFKAAKVRERRRLDEGRRRGDKVKERGLSAGSVNKVLKVAAQILDDAVEYGHLDVNPARGRKRRLKAAKPRRTWLELDEVTSLLEAAEGSARPLIAVMMLAGLRVSEATGLRWRAIDLARGVLTVEESKTDAGEGRKVDLTPMLREELTVHRASIKKIGPDDLVFPTSKGTPQHRANVGNRVVGGAVANANEARVKAGLPPIQEHVTNHTLRRTFASLLYEAEASPAYVMSQLGHASSALALEVYARKMQRSRDTGARIDALIRGADWAQMGTNPNPDPEPMPVKATKSPAERG